MMFYQAAAFNHDLSGWSISKGNDFNMMFMGASSFSQTLCWTIPAGASAGNMFSGSPGSVNANCPAPTPAPTSLASSQGQDRDQHFEMNTLATELNTYRNN